LNSTSVSSAAASSGAALRSTSSLRLQLTFRPCLRTQPPTPRSLHLRLHLPSDLRLASPISLPVAFRFNLRLAPPIESSGPYLFNPSARASDQTLGHLPIDLPLSLGIDLPAPPSDQPFSFRFRSTFRLLPSNSTSD
jgi:hypothetical protein